MAVPLDGHEVDDLDGARRADPAEVVAREVDEHQVLGALLLVGEQLLGELVVLGRRVAARPGAGDRVRGRPPAQHLDQRLRAGADDVEPVPVGVLGAGRGTCTGSGSRRAAPGRRRARRPGSRGRTAARARPGTPRRPGSPPCRRATAAVYSSAGAALPRGRRRPAPSWTATVLGAGSASCAGHAVEAGDGVRPRLVDALVGGVVVHRVGDEQQAAVGCGRGRRGRWPGIIDSSGTCELVRGGVRQPLPAADGVAADEADHAAGQRRQAGQPAACAARRRCRASASQRVAAGGDADRRVADPVRRRRPPRSAWPGWRRRRCSSATTRRRARPTPAGTCRAGRRRACGRRRSASRRRRGTAGRPGSPGGRGPARGTRRGPARCGRAAGPARGRGSVRSRRRPPSPAAPAPTGRAPASKQRPVAGVAGRADLVDGARARRRRRSRAPPPCTCCTWPEVSPLRQYSCRLRLQNVTRPLVSVRCRASSSIHPTMSTSRGVVLLDDRADQAVGVPLEARPRRPGRALSRRLSPRADPPSPPAGRSAGRSVGQLRRPGRVQARVDAAPASTSSSCVPTSTTRPASTTTTRSAASAVDQPVRDRDRRPAAGDARPAPAAAAPRSPGRRRDVASSSTSRSGSAR